MHKVFPSDIYTWLWSLPGENVQPPIEAVEVTIKGHTAPAGRYNDRNGIPTLYIQVYNPIAIVRKHDRFIDQDGQIWYTAAYMQGNGLGSVDSAYAAHHPFGENLILKLISPEMAQSIQLGHRTTSIEVR